MKDYPTTDLIQQGTPIAPRRDGFLDKGTYYLKKGVVTAIHPNGIFLKRINMNEVQVLQHPDTAKLIADMRLTIEMLLPGKHGDLCMSDIITKAERILKRTEGM